MLGELEDQSAQRCGQEYKGFGSFNLGILAVKSTKHQSALRSWDRDQGQQLLVTRILDVLNIKH